MSENSTHHPFTDDQYAEVTNGGIISDMTLTVKDGVYDFKYATIENLVITALPVTITNLFGTSSMKLTYNESGKTLTYNLGRVFFNNVTIDMVNGVLVFSSLNVSVENSIHDFGGATINNLNVNNASITVKNANVTGKITVAVNAHNCRFENVSIKSQSQAVEFIGNASNTLFEKCSFEGLVDENEVCPATVMNANSSGDLKINGNVILSDCHFKNYKSVIYAKREVSCIFNNCCSENVSYIIYEDGYWATGDGNITIVPLKANVVINNLHSIDLSCVFSAKKLYSSGKTIKTNANIVVNGVFDKISGAVVDFEDGVVNLECNISGTSDYKLFSGTLPKTRYCNIQKYGDNAYRVVPEAKTYEFTMTLQPNETRYPFDSMHINSISGTANSNVEVFFRKNTVENDDLQTVDEDISLSTDGVSINDTGTLVFKNTATTIQTFSFTVTTNCKLF